MTLRERAEQALAQIGERWSADALESSGLDFKQTHRSGDRRAPEKFYKDLAESAVCFANGQGGLLLIGVANKAASRREAIVGVDSTRWPIDELLSSVHARTSPPITVHTATLQVERKTSPGRYRDRLTLRGIDLRVSYRSITRSGQSTTWSSHSPGGP